MRPAIISLLSELVGNQRKIRRQMSDLERYALRTLKRLDTLMTQNEDVAAAVASISDSNTELRELLVSVAGDVQGLKDKIDQLPTGGDPLDPALVAQLQADAAELAQTTSGFRALDDSTPASNPEPDPGPEPGFE